MKQSITISGLATILLGLSCGRTTEAAVLSAFPDGYFEMLYPDVSSRVTGSVLCQGPIPQAACKVADYFATAFIVREDVNDGEELNFDTPYARAWGLEQGSVKKGGAGGRPGAAKQNANAGLGRDYSGTESTKKSQTTAVEEDTPTAKKSANAETAGARDYSATTGGTGDTKKKTKAGYGAARDFSIGNGLRKKKIKGSGPLGNSITYSQIQSLLGSEQAVVQSESSTVESAAEETAEEPAPEETPVEETSMEEPAAEDAPVEGTTVEEPAEEPPAEEAAVEETSVGKPAAEEEPVVESTTEEPIAEEAPVEETTVEEPAAEETPEAETAEEPVADETAGEETAEEVVTEAESVVTEAESVVTEAESVVTEAGTAEETAEEPAAEQEVVTEAATAEASATEKTPVEEETAAAAEEPAKKERAFLKGAVAQAREGIKDAMPKGPVTDVLNTIIGNQQALKKKKGGGGRRQLKTTGIRGMRRIK